MSAHFGRLAEISPADGDLTPMEDIKDTDLLLVGIDARTTQYGEGYMLTLTDLKGEETFNCLTSAVVVTRQVRQIEEAGHKLPMIVSFVKSGKAWTIV